jgi:hypothetical protein
LDRFHEIFSSEPEEIECCFASDTIDFQKFTKEFFLSEIDESEERLSGVIDIMMEPDI